MYRVSITQCVVFTKTFHFPQDIFIHSDQLPQDLAYKPTQNFPVSSVAQKEKKTACIRTCMVLGSILLSKVLFLQPYPSLYNLEQLLSEGTIVSLLLQRSRGGGTNSKG